MNVSLVLVRASGRRDFPLRKERVVVGRDNDCDLRIPVASVSRHHCELLVAGGQITLRDLGSSNGTFHNHTRVQEAALKPGDRVGIGPVTFHVVVDGQPRDIKPAAPAKGASVSASSAAGEEIPVLLEDSTAGEEAALSALQALTDLDDEDETPPPAKPSAPKKPGK